MAPSLNRTLEIDQVPVAGAVPMLALTLKAAYWPSAVNPTPPKRSIPGGEIVLSNCPSDTRQT